MLRAAAESLRAGRTEEGLRAALEVLRSAPEEAGALHLAGVALTRLGRLGEAAEALEKAVRLAPHSAACHLGLGNALLNRGDHARAAPSFARALQLEPANADAGYQLARCRHEAGDRDAAIALLHAVACDNPMDYDASQQLVAWVAEQVSIAPYPGRDASVQSADTPSAWRGVTVGFCSIDASREQRTCRALEAALSPTPCEFHVVRNPRSLSEGFNRILDEAAGELLILCHDDIEVMTPRLDFALQRALSAADLVGVAGSSRVAGPAVLWAGHPHIHGWVTYPRGDALEVAPLSLRCGIIPGMQALDGVFMAMRPDVARAIRFDAAAFDGFHFYDLDFSYRAHLAGLRLAVTTDVLLAHASEGSFDESWRRYAERFLAKHAGLGEPKGAPHWYGARVDSAARALDFYDRLRKLARAQHGPGP